MQNLQNKVSEMQAKIEKLEQEMSAKAWNVERKLIELIKNNYFCRTGIISINVRY